MSPRHPELVGACRGRALVVLLAISAVAASAIASCAGVTMQVRPRAQNTDDSHPRLEVQVGHATYIEKVLVSSDGRLLASISRGVEEKTVVWDAATGREVLVLPLFSAIQFTKDGLLLGLLRGGWRKTGGGDELQLVDPRRGHVIASLLGFADGLVMADGRLFAYAASESVFYFFSTGKMAVFARGEAKPLAQYDLPTYLDAFALSADGARLAVSEFGQTELRDAQTGEVRWTASENSSVYSLAFCADDSTIVARGHEVVLGFDAATGAERWRVPMPGLANLALATDRDLVILANADGLITGRRCSTGAVAPELPDTNVGQKLDSIAAMPDASRVYLASGSEVVEWDLARAAIVRRIKGQSLPNNVVAFVGDELLAVGRQTTTIGLWSLREGRLARELGPLEESPQLLVPSRDNTLLFATFGLGGFAVLDVARGSVVRSFRAVPTEECGASAISSDGRLVAFVRTPANGTGLPSADDPPRTLVQVFDTETTAMVREIPSALCGETVGSTTGIAFRPGSHELACERLRGVRIVDVDSGAMRQDVSLSSPVGKFAFDPSGAQLTIAVGLDEAVVVDAATGERHSELESARVPYSLAMGKGGVVAAGDNSFWLRDGDPSPAVRLWTPGESAPAALYGHAAWVSAVAFSPNGRWLASAAADGSVRLWSIDRRAPVATLVGVGHSDWVVVTPDGRFDGSSAGIGAVHWVVGGEVLPLDGYFERYYTPKLLAQTLGNAVASLAPGEPSQPAPALVLSKPPAVSIVSPRPGEQPAEDTVQVVVAAEDRGDGVDEVRLFHNGKRVDDPPESRGVRRQGQYTFSVTLTPGHNELVASALSLTRAEGFSAPVRLEWLARLPTARLFVLAVGIDEYANPNYKLNYGSKDARAFVEALAAGGSHIFSSVVKREIYDAGATKSAITQAFGDIAAQARPEDVFAFFYAGHGVMSEGSRGLPSSFYVVPTDVTRLYGDDEALARKGISGQELRDLAVAIKAQKQLFVLDACQSGGAVDSFATRGAAEEKAILQLARSAGIVVLAATGSEQLAGEVAQLGHGIFTYALLRGLGGLADGAPADGKITVKELEAYVNETVPELTKQYRGTVQLPNSFARGQDFPLALK